MNPNAQLKIYLNSEQTVNCRIEDVGVRNLQFICGDKARANLDIVHCYGGFFKLFSNFLQRLLFRHCEFWEVMVDCSFLQQLKLDMKNLHLDLSCDRIEVLDLGRTSIRSG